MFTLTLNMQVTFKKVKSSTSVKKDIPEVDMQVDRSKKSDTKTTSVDWLKLVKITYYLTRIFAWIVILINS